MPARAPLESQGEPLPDDVAAATAPWITLTQSVTLPLESQASTRPRKWGKSNLDHWPVLETADRRREHLSILPKEKRRSGARNAQWTSGRGRFIACEVSELGFGSAVPTYSGTRVT